MGETEIRWVPLLSFTRIWPTYLIIVCRAILLRRHICSFQIIPDDAVPVFNGPAKGVSDDFGFKERTLDFYFGKRRDIWPFIAYGDQIYGFSKFLEWGQESIAEMLAQAEQNGDEPNIGTLGGMLLDILEMPYDEELMQG